MEQEIWKPAVGYEGLYEVSNLGNVKSLGKKDARGHLLREKILKPTPDKGGYLQLCLSNKGKIRGEKVHRLVAEAFIPNDAPLFKTDINHINENKTDNRISNLEWCTKVYNNNYGSRNERVSKSNINGKNSKPILQFALDGRLIAEYPSAMEIKRQLGFSNGNISACCNGKRKKANGFIWKFKKEED